MHFNKQMSRTEAMSADWPKVFPGDIHAMHSVEMMPKVLLLNEVIFKQQVDSFLQFSAWRLVLIRNDRMHVDCIHALGELEEMRKR